MDERDDELRPTDGYDVHPTSPRPADPLWPESTGGGAARGEPDDVSLWAPAKAMPVPPPDPSFMASLMARLDEVDSEGTLVDAETHPRTARRWAWPRLRIAVAAAAAAAVVLGVVLTSLPDETQVVQTPQTPTIAAVRTRMNEAMAKISTLQGELVVTDVPAALTSDASLQFVVFGESEPAPEQTVIDSAPAQTLADSAQSSTQASPDARREMRLRFTLTAAGDARIESGTPGQGDYFLTTFDSGSQTMQELVERPGREPSFSVYRGENALPGGPLDPLARLDRMLGSYVRSILEQGATGWRIADVVYEGRPAWRLTGPAPQAQLSPGLEANPSPEPRDLVIIIDKELGLPVRLASSSNGVVRHDERLEGIVLNAAEEPGLFAQSPPQHATVVEVDYGYRRGSLSWAARKADYRPLIPTLLPAGYHLSAVLCQAAKPSGSQTSFVAEPDHGVTLVYRRGFDAFVVATHVLQKGVTEWGGATGIVADGGQASQQWVTLTAGELAGETGRIAVTYVKPLMLLVRNENHEYLIDGDLTRDELLGVANSLAEWSP